MAKAKGADAAFAGEAAKWFHEAGLSTRQAAALAERYGEHVSRGEARRSSSS